MKKKLPKKFIKKKEVIFQKPKRTLEFPNISRLIPERSFSVSFSPKIFLLSFICGFLLMAIVSEVYAIIQDQRILTSIQTQQDKMKKEITYWEQVVSIHKDYRDGYFKLALLAQQVGDKERAKEYLKKTLELDPDFAEGKSYKTTLQ